MIRRPCRSFPPTSQYGNTHGWGLIPCNPQNFTCPRAPGLARVPCGVERRHAWRPRERKAPSGAPDANFRAASYSERAGVRTKTCTCVPRSPSQSSYAWTTVRADRVMRAVPTICTAAARDLPQIKRRLAANDSATCASRSNSAVPTKDIPRASIRSPFKHLRGIPLRQRTVARLPLYETRDPPIYSSRSVRLSLRDVAGNALTPACSSFLRQTLCSRFAKPARPNAQAAE